MRVSYVLLAVILPALFSSLVTVSALGESRGVQNSANELSKTTALATLAEEWERSVHDVDDDLDDGLASLHVNVGVEKYIFCTGNIAEAKSYAKLRANIIRGPPSYT
ncbi:hypothetical protein ACI7YQ_18285 [Alteromonas marina]|uniref:hypothetical protein n=1 Tax=unclassified Alteromonas TaxID=2614992 RepID=UPI0019168736|nr:hypothetical protein [Alteromonas sp. KUL150]